MEYIDESDRRRREGLLLLGWHDTVRLTSEDQQMLLPICDEAVAIHARGELTPDKVDELASRAFDVLSFQVAGVQERADRVSLVYYNSKYLRPLLNIIDEATICFYRGYTTAALALLFVLLEKYLRSLYGWKPGDKDPSFADLKRSVLSLPNSRAAERAYKVLNVIYARYDALSPAQFEFNRHSLLHGIRGASGFDEMNCARIFQLLNLLCAAEEVDSTGYGDALDLFRYRYDIYGKCGRNKLENMLIRANWQAPLSNEVGAPDAEEY